VFFFFFFFLIPAEAKQPQKPNGWTFEKHRWHKSRSGVVEFFRKLFSRAVKRQK